MRVNGMWPIPKLPPIQQGYRVGFFGPMASGKTYCADYLVKNYGYYKLSLADKLKAIAYELYGTVGKDGDARRIYQELGDKLRSFDDDVFTKYTLSTINNTYTKARIVIDDVRLPREAELLKAAGFKLIRVDTLPRVRQERIEALYPNVPQDRQSHATERSFNQIGADASILSDIPADIVRLDKILSGWFDEY